MCFVGLVCSRDFLKNEFCIGHAPPRAQPPIFKSIKRRPRLSVFTVNGSFRGSNIDVAGDKYGLSKVLCIAALTARIIAAANLLHHSFSALRVRIRA